MSIILTKDVRIAGSIVAAGPTVRSYAAELEGDLVARGVAIYASAPRVVDPVTPSAEQAAAVVGAGVVGAAAIVTNTPEQNTTAINDILLREGVVCLPRGTIEVAKLPGQTGTYQGAIRMRDGDSIIGRGSSTVLKLADAQDCCVIVNDDQTNGDFDLNIERLQIDGNRTGQSGLAAGFAGEGEGTISGCYLYRCTDVSLTKLRIKNADGHGLLAIGGGVDADVANDWDVDNILAEGNALNGVQMSFGLRRVSMNNIRCQFNERHGILIDASEMTTNNVKAVRNYRDGIYIRNVHSCNLNGLTAYNNGRNGIAVLAYIASMGAGWLSMWNGRRKAQEGDGDDVYFGDDGTAEGWNYGTTTQSMVNGIVCGPAVGAGLGIEYADGSNASAPGVNTAVWSLRVDPNVTGTLQLLGVSAQGNGTSGGLSYPNTGNVYIEDVAGGTKNKRIAKGSLLVLGASTSSAAAPADFVRLGTYRLWVDNGGLLRIKNTSDPANSTDGTVVGTQT